MALNRNNTKKEIDQYHRQKAISSFKARFDLLLYYWIRNGLKRDITTDDLQRFEIEDNLKVLDEYIQVYWQQETDNSIRGNKINDIYIAMKKWKEDQKANIDDLQKHYITNMYERIFPSKDFFQMIKDGIECHYCHTSIDQINSLIEKGKIYKKHITRGWSLEIDRMKPNYEYTKGNCVICCYWCNNAKTDEFSYDEFVEIGKEIEKVWHGRLNSK